ncbi:MAG: glycosyl hydrolase 53 family protein, partial [Lachnospiraceae bacterium]|nr:glycosyl hydrolase 53 family protein [Lachnospiraceae bacterium]
MKHTFRRILFLLLAVCLLASVSMMTAKANGNGTATLSSTTMTESGSITVNFSETATSTSFYNVQIADSNWSTTYVNTYITSGDSYTIAGYAAGTYQIYIGYYESYEWVDDALSTTTFTVTEDEAVSYGLSLSISDSAPALGDSVTVTAAFNVEGTEQNDVPHGCTLSIWYQSDSDWVTPVNGSSSTTSATISLSSDSFTEGTTYTVQAELYDSSWNVLASGSVTFTVAEDDNPTSNGSASLSSTTMTESGSITVTFSGTATSDEYYNVQIANSDWTETYINTNITSGDSYTISGYSAGTYHIYIGYCESAHGGWVGHALTDTTFTVTEDGAATETYAVTITPSANTCEQNESLTFTATVTYGGEEIDLTSQSDIYLWIWADSWADGHSDGLTDCSISPNTGLANSVTIEFPSVGTYYIAYTLEDSSYAEISKSTDVAVITVTGSTADPSEDITTGDLSCDFMRGMDLSTFYTSWTNGAVYYDYDGNEYSQAKGNAVAFFEFLYDECGVDWVRLRVWNDPYDEDGNPYGGGNNDVATAAIIGAWASEAGMTVLIDFHYSDFWADPGRQLAPKAWANMDIDEKVEALYEYTYDSLTTLLDAGVNVGMVQVGNETNGALCGEAIDWSTTFDASTNETWQNIVKLFESGSKAVRAVSAEYNTTIKVALHFTNPNNANPSWYAGLLDDAGVDYDALGISYYMYWHGTLSNLASEISTIYNTYGKEVFIAETAYPYTSENFDSLANSVSAYDDFDMNANLYAISEEGQEAALTAILDTVANTEGCTGLFYWEPAWTALDSSTLDSGTGWATRYANDYLTDYDITASEGSSFDNQTLFDNGGNALAALKFFMDYVSGSLPEHDYELDDNASTASTCTEDGENVYVCTVCGDSYTETVAATGHDYEAVITNPTCTEGGYTTYTCTVCGDSYTADETEATGHDYEAVITNPTCTEGGYTTYTCTVCGDSYTADETEATGHTTEVQNAKDATCTEDGYTGDTVCTVCGVTVTAGETI